MAGAPTVTYLFSDIEGSTRLWESDADGAARAMAWHDEISRNTVRSHGGTVVKMTGDGMHAAFEDAGAAAAAVIDLQIALASPVEGTPPVKVRCGLHLGVDQRRDNDFFGPAVNRAARIMSAAHGGQILVSQAVADRVAQSLPQGASLRELGQVRLKDLSNPERVFQLVHPALRVEFPALRSLASVPNNLPQQLNSFVGREREMAEVRALLAKGRLVTLLAMGGVGKSRLSIQLGAEVLDEFPDGVWLVELAPLTEGVDVPQSVAAVLGVKEEASGGVVDALIRFVRDRTVLLILDNCEHVVRGVAALAKTLLQAGPNLRILASSRDPLQIAGELAYHVPTLPVPELRDTKPAQLEKLASVQLFLDRATAAQPAFTLTDRVAASVAEICRRLDGIPLALELAAARARSLPVDVIAERLDQRFRLLTTADQTVLPRQRTLRALIDWSFDLLDERERTLFRRLSVFAGGWSLEAAEAVMSADGIEAFEVLDAVTGLVEKSLVLIEPDTGRYRMLETVRNYADEKLVESGERDRSRGRHLVFYADLAEEARPRLIGPERAAWLTRLDAERDNLLAAHEAGCSLRCDISALVKIARGTRYYWFHRGQPSKGLQLYLDVLGVAGDCIGEADRCRLLFGAGQFCYYLGRHADARRYLSECLAIAERIGDDMALAAVLPPLGLACLDSGDIPAARAYLATALERARRSGDQREILAALTAVALMNMVDGCFEDAATELEEALRISRTTGDDESTARCLINCAVLDLRNLEVDRARERLQTALDMASQLKSESMLQYVLDGCLAFSARRERWPDAVACYAFSERLLEQMGRHRERADASMLKDAIEAVKDRVAATELLRSRESAVDVGEAILTARTALRP